MFRKWLGAIAAADPRERPQAALDLLLRIQAGGGGLLCAGTRH